MFATIVSLMLLVFCILILLYFYQGPAYVPTLKVTVRQMVEAAGIKQGTKVVDLGSGDGRVVIAMAQAGATAVGFEINPLLVWYSRWKIKRLGLQNKIEIKTTDFWRQDLGQFDVITIFGIDHIMSKLAAKLNSEIKPGTLVISNAFRLPGLQEVRTVGSLIVYQR